MSTFVNVCREHGIEDPETDEFVFDCGQTAAKVVAMLDSELTYDPRYELREWRLARTKSGKLVARCPYIEGDTAPGTKFIRKRRYWSACLGEVDPGIDPETLAALDKILRYKVRDDKATGWAIRHARGYWLHGFDSHLVGCYLSAKGFENVDLLKGHLVARPWKVVTEHFRPEEPGNRQWNYDAAQYTYEPKPGDCPHWDAILKHCGSGLDDELVGHPWAQRSGIKTGADYLLAWAAIMLREPLTRLPYLFFYSEKQNTGKSTYHEALSLLMTKGAASADRALTNTGDFNGELAGAVLAYIEEKNVAMAAHAYSRVKDWVTAPTIAIRKMRTDQYSIPNTLHFVQCANEAGACLARHGDTRITAISVPDLKNEIPKPVLMERLRSEAPAFMHRIMSLDLPKAEGRLGLPAIDTEFKRVQAENSVDDFARAVADYMAGRATETLTANQFAQLGEGDCPKSIRAAKKILESHASYLKSRGVTFSFPKRRTEHGFTVELRRVA